MKSALTLTEPQLERMARYIRHRIEGIEVARSHGWLADRERFEREWNDDFSHRAMESAVFAKSNESLNMVGSGVDYIRSRIMEEIFGSKPWFSVDSRVRKGGEVAADQVARHLRWKLGQEQVNFEGVAVDLITQACKMGECVSKIFYTTVEEEYERVATILWNHRTDAPARTADGDFIFRDEYEREEADELEWQPGERAPVRPLPAGHCWREQIVSEHRVHYAGARTMPLHYRDFYCPLNAPSLHDADFVAHMTSMRLSDLCAHLGVPPEEVFSETPGENYLAQTLWRIRQSGAQPDTAAGEPRLHEGKEPDTADADPEFRLLEAYFQFDARQDGRPYRVYVMMAYDFDLPIFWDYVANVTPNGRYPFEAVVINKEPYRWYGRSWFKKYETFQQLIDKLLNQIIYRNELAANPVKFRRKEAVVQWQDDQPFEIGPDKVFDLNDGYSASDALQSARIPELDDQTRYLLETIVASWRTRSGVTTATQGMFGGLPSENTATGVAQIVESGTTIFRPQVMDIKRGLEAVLRQLVRYQYTYQTGDEEFTYREGDLRVHGVLRREVLEGLEINIELTLTRARQLRRFDAARMAADFFAKFLAIPDEFKGVAAPLFSTIYKTLEIDNADDYFRQVVEITQLAEAEAASGSEEPVE